MKTLLLVLLVCGLQVDASAQTNSAHPTYSFPYTSATVPCRDFVTMKQTHLPLCDFVMTDQLKTNLLSLLITEQKSLDALLANTSLTPEKIKFYNMVKSHLFAVERFGIQKIADICHLKGRLILETSGLISGCIYNQLTKIKNIVVLLQKNIFVTTTMDLSKPSEEQKTFDVFINDLLFTLAEKNRNYYPDNAEIKALMAEVLKIYGGDGKSLYSSFLGICGLESLTKNPPSNNMSFISQCEADYLTDLRQTLFLAI